MAVKCTNKLPRPKANFNLLDPSYILEPPDNILDSVKSYKEENEQTIHFFNKNDFEAFGKGCCISLLDMIEKNPCSR